MDDARFDGMTRALGSLRDRRTTARTLAGGALASLGLRASHHADAKKKKKKCKKPKVKCGKKCCAAGQKCLVGKCAVPCTFVTAGSVMTLQANCTTTSVIEIPDGITLDGNGKTITLAGPPSGFAVAGLGVNYGVVARSGQASIENLAIRGTGLTGSCAVGGLIMHETAGSLTDVSVSDMCVAAIGLFASGDELVSLTRVSVARVSTGDGISAGRLGTTNMRVEIDDADLTSVAGVGISLRGVDGSITDSMVQTAGSAIFVESGSDLTVDGNQIEGATLGVAVFSGSTAAVTNNTVVGTGAAGSSFPAGVGFDGTSGGTATGNTISNFFDPDAVSVACGIFVEAGSTAVIGANSFPDPPGNEQNVCDNRP